MNYIEACNVLGVSPNDDLNSAKKAYKKMIKFYHPDNFYGDEEKLKYAEEMTKKVNEAWEYIQHNYENTQHANTDTEYCEQTTETTSVYTYEYPIYEPVFTKVTLIVTIVLIFQLAGLFMPLLVDSIYDVQHEEKIEYEEYIADISEEDRKLLELYNFTEVENGYSISPIKSKLSSTVILPETFDGVPIVAIEKDAFKDCDALKEIIMSDNIITIGEGAFESCTSLSTIKFSKSLKTIGQSAFENCVSIKELMLPESIEIVGSWAFKNCSNLLSVNIPKSLLQISSSTFADCSNLKSIHIPSSVEEVDFYAFENCIGLEEIIIDEGVKISNPVWPVFTGCTNVKKAVVPDEWIRMLSDVHIEEIVIISVTDGFSIVTFNSIESISILKDLETITAYDFYYLDSLEEIHLPDSVKKIECNAIVHCPVLSAIYYDGTLEQWKNVIVEDGAFENNITIHCSDGTMEYTRK